MKRLLYVLERLAFVITAVPGIPFGFLWVTVGLLIIGPILFIFGNIDMENTLVWLVDHEPYILWANSIDDRH